MPRTVTIASQTAHLAEVRRFVRGCAAEAGLSDRAAAQVQLAVDEAVANAIEHGYRGQTDGAIDIEAGIRGRGARRRFVVTVRHGGVPFDAALYHPAALKDALQNRQRRGYGMRLIHQLMDEVAFGKKGAQSEVRLSKKFDPAPTV